VLPNPIDPDSSGVRRSAPTKIILFKEPMSDGGSTEIIAGNRGNPGVRRVDRKHTRPHIEEWQALKSWGRFEHGVVVTCISQYRTSMN
jgi:hypothetical protein